MKRSITVAFVILLLFAFSITYAASKFPVLPFDLMSYHELQEEANPAFDILMQAVSYIGETPVAALLMALTIALFVSRQQWTEAVFMLATSSSQVSRSSSAQADAASTVAAAVEEVSVSVSETATNAHAAGEIVEKTRIGAERALSVMAETVQNVNGIAVLIRESDASVARLDESSKKIGGIIQVIKEVADQTNLLALNAAIEAARAGEQGRGFAVVADEVRKIAERTSNATTEISSLISDIQNRIGGTIEGMHKANSQVEESLVLVGKTETALHHIGDDSREAASNVQSIADAVREQDAAIQQVAANIEKIAQMAEENSIATASSSDTAVRLDGLSSALKDSVARFKV